MGVYFYPRGGSAHATRALVRELDNHGIEVTLLAGSRSDLGEAALASSFYEGLDLRAVDFTPALRSPDPLLYTGGAPLTAPMHGSYEDRPGAVDPVLASLDDDELELQVAAWAAALETAAGDGIDLLYLHHLTPLNEAAARVLPQVPVIGHVHGTELLMLEEIEQGPPAAWEYAQEWAARLRRWAAQCRRIIVNDRGGLTRAAALLGLEEEGFACIPNGFDVTFVPGEVDRRAHWHRHLVERPRGWLPGDAPGSVAYRDQDLEALDGTVLLAVGRFTEVKRLPLLIEAFAEAQTAFDERAALVLIGGYPGASGGDDRAHRRPRRLPRRLARARRAAPVPPGGRPPRPRLGARAVRPGPGRGDGLRPAGDRGQPRRPRLDRRRSRDRLAGRAGRSRRPRGSDGRGGQRRSRPPPSRAPRPRRGPRPLLLVADWE